MYLNETEHTCAYTHALPMALTHEPYGIEWIAKELALPTHDGEYLVSHISDDGEPSCSVAYWDGAFMITLDEFEDILEDWYAWAALPRPCWKERYWNEPQPCNCSHEPVHTEPDPTDKEESFSVQEIRKSKGPHILTALINALNEDA